MFLFKIMNNILHLYSKIYDKRRKQLIHQSELDEKLYKLDCHREVIDFFILERKIARQMSKNTDDIPFRKLNSMIEKNITEVNNDYLELDRILNNDNNVCYDLSVYNQNKMKKYGI
jgi:hypothetical protein